MKETNTNIYWMQQAILLAKDAKMRGEIPVGAVLVYKDKLVTKAYNCLISNNDPSAHAEILALREAGRNFKNYRLLNTTLYVTLEPCIMCAGAIIHARIARLVYGSKNQKSGAAGSIINVFNHFTINHHILVIGGILVNECSELLSSFFKERRLEKKCIKNKYTRN